LHRTLSKLSVDRWSAVPRLPTAILFALSLIHGAFLQAEEIVPPEARPVVYLTFDDGPSEDDATYQILDTLRYHGVRATFFVLGSRVARAPEKFSAIVDAGHAVGNHTWSHKILPAISSAEIEREFDRSSRIARSVAGVEMNCYRPPFGSQSQRVVDIAAGRGLSPVLWSIDTRDWQPESDSDSIRAELRNSVDGSIVLMHDGPVRRYATPQALSLWLAEAVHKYRFAVPAECENGFEQTILATLDRPANALVSADFALSGTAQSEALQTESAANLTGLERPVSDAAGALDRSFEELPDDTNRETNFAVKLADASDYQSGFYSLLSPSDELSLGASTGRTTLDVVPTGGGFFPDGISAAAEQAQPAQSVRQVVKVELPAVANTDDSNVEAWSDHATKTASPGTVEGHDDALGEMLGKLRRYQRIDLY